MNVNYCPSCGHSLEYREINEEIRKACPVCPYVFWGNYSIGVGALVKKDDKILLIRRKQNPGKGKWTNPGGFIEQHEPIEETIVREVYEETGIVSKVNGIVALRDLPSEVHNVYIVFSMDYLKGEPNPDYKEVSDAGFFSLEEIENMNVAKLTRALINVAYNHPSYGLISNSKIIADHEIYRIQQFKNM